MSNEDDEDDDLEDEDLGDEERLLTCDVCGLEEEEEKADETWIIYFKPDVIEVLVCTKCSESEKNLEEAFKLFLKELANAKKRAMT